MPYSVKQRTRNGVIERCCRYCSAWWPLGRFPKSTSSVAHGRLAKCKACFNAGRLGRKQYPPSPAARERRNAKRRAIYRKLVNSGIPGRMAVPLRTSRRAA